MVADVKEATRVARSVRVGGKTHRLSIVLESDRSEGRHYVDGVYVAPSDFDRVMSLAEMPGDQL